MGPTQPRIIYCLECEKSSSSSTAKFHLPTTTVVAPPGITPTNSQKPESKTDKIILAKSGGAVSTSLLKVVNQTTTILTTEQTTIPTTIEVESSTISAITTTTEDPVTTSVVPTSTSFTSSITTSTSASTSTTDSLHTHIAPIIMNKPWVKSWILRQPFTSELYLAFGRQVGGDKSLHHFFLQTAHKICWSHAVMTSVVTVPLRRCQMVAMPANVPQVNFDRLSVENSQLTYHSNYRESG